MAYNGPISVVGGCQYYQPPKLQTTIEICGSDISANFLRSEKSTQMSKTKNIPVKAWCFTDQIPADAKPAKPAIDEALCQYLVAQQEIAPTTGQRHWQGYVYFKKNMRLSACKKLLPRAHWEASKGSPEQNQAYCTKEESRAPDTLPYEVGTPPIKGKRTDLDSFKDAVRSGKRMRELADEGFLSVLARYPRLYANLSALTRPDTNPDRKVVLLYGKAGAGKTRHVMDKHGKTDELYLQPISNGTPWFDGYDGHKVALLDDFDGAASKVPLTQTLKLLDIYPIQVPTKGGHAWWNPDTIYITTNLKPSDWYDFSSREEQYHALIRRISEAHCWDPETGFYTHCKTKEEVKEHFPFAKRGPIKPVEDARYPLKNPFDKD